MTPWGPGLPPGCTDVTVLVNDDARGRCWVDGCQITGDLVVTPHGGNLERDAVCCSSDHWLPFRRWLINRGRRIEYGEGAAELIMAKLAPRAVLHRRSDP